MCMCIRARDTSHRRKGVYTYARVVIRLYYIDKEKNRECVRSERASERASESERMCVCKREVNIVSEDEKRARELKDIGCYGTYIKYILY